MRMIWAGLLHLFQGTCLQWKTLKINSIYLWGSIEKSFINDRNQRSLSQAIHSYKEFGDPNACKKLQTRMPTAYEAYLELLELQSDPYIAHTKWAEIDKSFNKNTGTSIGEVVRVSMIECRSHRITTYEEFEEILKRYSQHLKRVKSVN